VKFDKKQKVLSSIDKSRADLRQHEHMARELACRGGSFAFSSEVSPTTGKKALVMLEICSFAFIK
jgi:hypothetical protein